VKREEEIKSAAQLVDDNELVYRLRHMATLTDQPTQTVMGALAGTIADDAISVERAKEIAARLVDEGVIEGTVQKLNAPGILPDSEALDLIAREMNGRQWSPDTLDVIAAYVRATGRTVDDLNEGALE
jgi:hypothetical protein